MLNNERGKSLMETQISQPDTQSLENWKRGLKAGIPICLGYFAVSFTFGIQAGNIGISPIEAIVLSATNLTSAGQFAGLEIIAAQSSLLEMAITQFIINMRYLLMSCALSQKLEKGTSFLHRMILSYGVTDEIFGVSVCSEGALSPYYNYGMMCVAVPGWTFGTFLGVVFGNIMPQSIMNAFGIAIYGMFIAVIIPAAKKDKVITVVIVAAMAISTMFEFIPLFSQISGGFRIIIITIAVSAFAAWKFPVKDEGEQNE